ncbi:Bor family protein [Litoribacillus peritrichatus]|uniref:Bor family protein n=1 Tax=Litoribacillus peritrichatus TaxID=718191 RepID=A0ABP7N8S2_9GAMM
MSQLRTFIIAGLYLMLMACSSVTIHPTATFKYSSEPTYQDSRHFFFWGLVGQTRVDVKQICQQKRVVQMQSQATFVDGLLTLITLGIYAPHSVKVWCE